MAMYGEKLAPPKQVKVPPPVRKPPRLWPVKPEQSTSTKLYGGKSK